MNSSCLKSLDFTIVLFALLLVLFTINIDYHILGMEKPFFEIHQWHFAFSSFVFFTLIILLILDLVVKYSKIRNGRKFAKKYWMDILMVVLIPVFGGFKILKVAVNLIKYLKLAKLGFKITHKINKHK